ncbi:hypothetical protein MD484_g6945, partial [Candolleomyces efflorescens]
MSGPQEYSVFANPEFDPSDYANAILAGESYPLQDSKPRSSAKSAFQDSIAKEDISVAISKLTFGIDDVSKQIKSLVSAHHEHLLGQAASASNLSGSLVSVRSGLNELNNSLEKLQQRVHVPYEALQLLVARLRKLQEASDILRRTSRFVILARRLQLQMSEMQSATGDKKADKPSVIDTGDSLASATVVQSLDIEDDRERTIAKAALTISEISSVLDGPSSGENSDASSNISLRNINAVAAFEPFVEEARNQNQTVLASSLQTAFNLGVLPELVRNLLHDLSQAVEDRIKSAFDLSKISKEALTKEGSTNSPSLQSYRSRVRTEPTNLTAPQFAAALWTRLEAMFDEMAGCCIKVYALEKVLKIKKNPNTLGPFLDDVSKALDNQPSAMFWLSLSITLDKHFRDSAKASAFLQQTLVTGYPKVLRLFHQFFSRIAVHTDTVYADSQQSPETILVLRSLANLESQYLSRSGNKINEAITQAFSGGSRMPPNTTEASNVARVVANELDSAKFDPLLVKSVAKNVASCLENVVAKVDNLMARDRSAVSLFGPTATPQHELNASLATFLYQLSLRLLLLESEHTASVYALVRPSIKNIQDGYETLVQPMQQAIQREISAILAKLHRIDFGQTGGGMAGGSSFCVRELSEKLAFIKGEVLDCYDLGDAGRVWVVSIVKFTIRNFLLHISIAKPLSEVGKLQMTSDMTELEFALNAFMAENNQAKRGDNLQNLGEEYRALRAMRPLLFLENKQLSSAEATANLPPLIVLHHILVRSPIPLPHKLHGWQEAEYVRWLDEHTDQESWTLIDGGITMSLASVLRARTLARGSATARLLSSTSYARKDDPPKPPQPPKPIDDSTSALEYKRFQRSRPPPLPAAEVPRFRSAEEAVTNILYNTPPPNLQPFKKHILNCLVQNEPGVLSRVSGILAGRGFNIDSLVVCRTEIRDLSRMCIVLSGQDSVIEQARRQLEDLVPVWAVLDYTETRVISRELLLAKVSILGPEYVDEQFIGGPFHEPRRPDEVSKLEREAALAQNFEQRGATPAEGVVEPTLTPSEALRLKHQHLQSIAVLAKQFGAKVVDVSEHSVIVELTAKTSRVEAFLNLLKPFGILEAARTGTMAMPRTPIRTDEEDQAEALGGSVDASLLPPG